MNMQSHPTRVRGLKRISLQNWRLPRFCRTPRGCDRALSVRQTGKPVFGEKRRKKREKDLKKGVSDISRQ